MNTGYTHRINFFKKVPGLGWVEESFPTTNDAVNVHLNKLNNRSDVRCVDVVPLINIHKNKVTQ